jgi:hypothetical protein
MLSGVEEPLAYAGAESCSASLASTHCRLFPHHVNSFEQTSACFIPDDSKAAARANRLARKDSLPVSCRLGAALIFDKQASLQPHAGDPGRSGTA